MTERYDSENGREPATERYAAVDDGAGEVVVYDTENSAAWLKSDAAVSVEEMV